MCMEFLGHLIEEKCAAKLWSSVKASRSGPSFLHLFFADDLVLFASADQKNCHAISDVLQEFCSRSGQSVSEAKSRVFFSPNMGPDQRDSLSSILGFRSTSNLGSYLGFPLKHPGVRSHDFGFVLDRVKRKLAGWKANLLFMASRLVLIHASFSTVPNYAMQYVDLPSKILNSIDRVNRNFLWGSTDQIRKMHWVNWKEVTKPKEASGLGLQSVIGRNTALLAKLNWRLHSENNGLWAKVLKFKYCNRQRVNSRNVANLPCSPIWKGIKRGEDTFKKGVKWISGHESTLNFWTDCWSNLGPIRSRIQGPLLQAASNLQVKIVLSLNGWNWAAIPFVLPKEVMSDILAVPTPLVARCSDKVAWKFSPKGGFDMKSTYLLATSLMDDESFSGSWIWKLPILPRIQIFIWKCMHHSISVKDCLPTGGSLLIPPTWFAT